MSGKISLKKEKNGSNSNSTRIWISQKLRSVRMVMMTMILKRMSQLH